MKFAKFIPLLFACLLPTWVLAQEAKPEKYEDVSWYSADFTKFKPGMQNEARAIIYDHFVPTDADIGRKVVNFDFSTGEWDHVVFFPFERRG